MFEKIKRWYCLGLWTEAMVRTAREKGLLTGAQTAQLLGGEEA